MKLPGMNQLVNNIYQKSNLATKTNQKNKQADNEGKNNDAVNRKNTYSKSAEYIKSKHNTKASEAELDPISNTTKKAELSDKAKEYLEKLRSKYTNMDIMVNDGLSDNEVRRHLNRGQKEYNVMIDVETLERMASDESVKNEYEGILDNAGKVLDDVKKELGDDAKYIKSIGINVDSDGKVEYFSIIDKSLEKNHINEKKNINNDKKSTEKKSNENKISESKKKVSSFDLDEFLQKVKDAVAKAKEKEGTIKPSGFDAVI